MSVCKRIKSVFYLPSYHKSLSLTIWHPVSFPEHFPTVLHHQSNLQATDTVIKSFVKTESKKNPSLYNTNLVSYLYIFSHWYLTCTYSILSPFMFPSSSPPMWVLSVFFICRAESILSDQNVISSFHLRCEWRDKIARHQESGEVEQIDENLSLVSQFMCTKKVKSQL